MRRRSFIAAGSAFAALFPHAKAGRGNASKVSGELDGKALLKVGIVSDTHVNDRSRKEKIAMLEKVLRLFDREKNEIYSASTEK